MHQFSCPAVSTTFDIYDNVGTHLLSFSKPFFGWGDQWHVQLANNTAVANSLAADPRVVGMIAGYKTGRKNSGLGSKSLVLISCIVVLLVGAVAAFVIIRRRRRRRSGYHSINF